MFVSRIGAAFISLSLIAHSAVNAVASDWPQFRGPEGQGHASAMKLPTEWSTTKNVVWSQEIPGAGWSSPVTYNGKVFLTTAVQPGGSGNVALQTLCLNETDGKTIWSTELFSIAPVSGGHKKNSHASPTPLVEDGKVYVHFGSYGTAALDLNGKVLWRNTLKYSPVHGNGGSPILVGDALIMSCDGAKDPFIVALNKQNGEVLWKTPRQGNAKKTFSFSTPLAIEVNGKTQVVSPTSGGVMAYNPRDGKEIWRVNYTEGYSVVPRPVFGHGLVFVSSAFDRPVVYAIDPKGTGDITDSAVKWTMTKGAPNTPSPLLVGDEIYFVSDNGIMTCADAKSGTVHWQERLDGKSSANYSASPLFADGKIYVQNEEGVGNVLKPGKTFEVLARNDLKERTLASYAVDDGALYIRTAQKLYRIGETR